jgi:hypothetical protein
MKRIGTILVLIVISFGGHSQTVNRLSVSYYKTPLQTLIDQIEKETPYRFFYLRAWIDTVDVTVTLRESPVQEVIRAALDNSGVNFFIDSTRVILTSRNQISREVDLLQPVARAPIPFERELIPEENAREQTNAVKQVGRLGAPIKSSYTLSGYIREKSSGEPVVGALVYTKFKNTPVATDPFGFYSILLPAGDNALVVEIVGMETLNQKISLISDGKLDFTMVEAVTQLKEVVVESDIDLNVSNIQMGVSKVDVRAMKNIPKVLGENDPLKVATTLPGVKSIGEGASGLNVRGGHADQNLVVLNEATIYNTSHFLGFFSVFNADAIRSFELYKSGIPVQHGGRLSSTFELLMRDGNQKKFSGQGGIGPITSHLTLEVPVIKDKTSIMFGGRSTYSNWIFRTITADALQNTRASFSDICARITHNINDKNTFYLSLYGSYDNFNLSSDTLFSYSNRVMSLQWRHVFTPDLDAIVSVTRSQYNYDVDYTAVPQDAFELGFAVRESNAKLEFNHSREKSKITFGVQSKLYQLSPGSIEKGTDSSLVKVRHIQHEKGLESALFLADNIEFNHNFSIYAGVRYSLFSALGPGSFRIYAPGTLRSDDTVTDTVAYKNNQVIKNFHGPEYRLSFRYKLTEESSIKSSYNRTRQYIHMLSNSVSVSPTDTWKLSDVNVQPQIADQVSFGYYQNIKRDVFEFSTEVYYKWIKNILDYKTGAILLVNENIEQQILQGKGKAYGVELLLRKKSGKLTGWLGYSYSRTFIQLNSPNPLERVNRGKYFPANYDKPHDVTMITNYKITRRYSFSLNFAYSTGRPITYPISAYRFGGTYRINYSDRNAYRIPDYMRFDVGFNMEGNHKIKKLAHSFWTVSIYNLLGRRNPYSVYFKIADEDIKAYQLSIFGVPVPTITYHFKF